jgi:hypothetical protein
MITKSKLPMQIDPSKNRSQEKTSLYKGVHNLKKRRRCNSRNKLVVVITGLWIRKI